MTRVKKYEKIREEIDQENRVNSEIWENQKKLEIYEKKLVNLDANYFKPIFTKINNEFNLLNLENNFSKKKYQYLQIKDKYLLIKLLSDINVFFDSYNETKNNDIEEELIKSSDEYEQILINMKLKKESFKEDLENKLKTITVFVQNIEKKYQKYDYQQTNDVLKEIVVTNKNIQNDYQKLKSKNKQNYKTTLWLFIIIVISLILIIVIMLFIFK